MYVSPPRDGRPLGELLTSSSALEGIPHRVADTGYDDATGYSKGSGCSLFRRSPR